MVIVVCSSQVITTAHCAVSYYRIDENGSAAGVVTAVGKQLDNHCSEQVTEQIKNIKHCDYK